MHNRNINEMLHQSFFWMLIVFFIKLFRSRRCESARRCFCERSPATRRGPSTNCGTCPPGGPPLRHQQTTQSLTWLCIKNTFQVTEFSTLYFLYDSYLFYEANRSAVSVSFSKRSRTLIYDQSKSLSHLSWFMYIIMFIFGTFFLRFMIVLVLFGVIFHISYSLLH